MVFTNPEKVSINNIDLGERIMPSQYPLYEIAEPIILIVILADTSGSMCGEPIIELNQVLEKLIRALRKDEYISRRAEVCIITFGNSIRQEVSFKSVDDLELPVLTAYGPTALNETIEVGLDAIKKRKVLLRNRGIHYQRPLLIILSDGQFTDIDHEFIAKKKLRKEIEEKKIDLLTVGIGVADIENLKEYYPDNYNAKIVLETKIASFWEEFLNYNL